MVFDEEIFYHILKEMIQVKAPSLEELPRVNIIKAFLQTHNIPYKTDDALNVIIELNPGKIENTIIIDAHTDIAGKGYAENIFDTGTKIKGQGCADDLAAVAMLLTYAVQLKNMDLKRPLTMLLSSAEEGRGNLKGIKTFIANSKGIPHIFISLDLSYNTLSFDGLGSRRFLAKINTKGGHSFEDYGSPNAIELMCGFILSVKENILNLKKQDITFNAGTFTGGKTINLIADYAEASFEFRSVSEETLDLAQKTVWDEIKKTEKENIRFSIEDIGSRPAAQGSDKENILKKILPVFTQNQLTPQIKPMSTNINAALKAKWPAFCMGICNCGNFHTEQEYFEKDSLEKGWNLLNGLIKEFGII